MKLVEKSSEIKHIKTIRKPSIDDFDFGATEMQRKKVDIHVIHETVDWIELSERVR